MEIQQPITFLGNTLAVIRGFSEEVKREIGHQLDRVQRGLEPDDWKPMKAIVAGAKEIRVRDKLGAFRVIYVVKRSDGILVLHAFQKKTEKTTKHDLDIAKTRYSVFLTGKNKKGERQ
ncbi:MAG: hypothetical protein A3F41_00550 [Coxiella sp. RIFCSPHIGHO2_12_FULL_44_14]|nr:MAG: hypothetical protein A3F41_00550 [Coxiella sp. RIFCSPHIGHO2_12_FULL_44_14]